MFSLVYHLVINPFPFKDASRERVICIHDATRNGGACGETFTIPEFINYREQNHVFDDMVGSYTLRVIVKTGGGAHDFAGAYVTTNVFDFYGMPVLFGRGFTPEDAKPGAAPVFVMNYYLWKSDFNSDPHIVGKTILVNGQPRTLVGVTPQLFQVYGANILLPLGLSPGSEGTVRPGNNPVYLQAIGLLKSGVSDSKAAADLEVISAQLAKAYPQDVSKKIHRGDPGSCRVFHGKSQDDVLPAVCGGWNSPFDRMQQRSQPPACSCNFTRERDRHSNRDRSEPASTDPPISAGEFCARDLGLFRGLLIGISWPEGSSSGDSQGITPRHHRSRFGRHRIAFCRRCRGIDHLHLWFSASAPFPWGTSMDPANDAAAKV